MTTTTSSSSTNMSSVTTPASVPPKRNIPLSMTASALMTTELNSLSMEAVSQSSGNVSTLETTKQTSNSAINEHRMCTSGTMLVNECILVNGTVNEHLIESVLEKIR